MGVVVERGSRTCCSFAFAPRSFDDRAAGRALPGSPSCWRWRSCADALRFPRPTPARRAGETRHTWERVDTDAPRTPAQSASDPARSAGSSGRATSSRPRAERGAVALRRLASARGAKCPRAAVPRASPSWPRLRSAGGACSEERGRLAATPDALPAQRTDYFALCLAAHFASAATYVPTDVDTKIRRALWRDAVGTDELERMRALALGLADGTWAGVGAHLFVDSASAPCRVTTASGSRSCVGASSRRSAAGGRRRARARGRDRGGARARGACLRALARARGRELELLRLAAILTHNAGDVMQGLAGAGSERARRALRRLARAVRPLRRRVRPRGRALPRASRERRPSQLSAARSARPASGSRAAAPDRAVPRRLGRAAGAHPRAGGARARGGRRGARRRAAEVPGPAGYYRALAGFDRAFPRGLEAPELAQHFPASTRGSCARGLRQKLAVPRESFESQLAKRARAMLARS